MSQRRMPGARRPSAAHAWLLAALLLVAQGLGLVHGVSHGLGHAVAHSLAQGTPQRDAPSCADAGHVHESRPVFSVAQVHGGSHEAGDAECRLIDQLAHADALFAAPAWAGLPPPGRDAPATAPRLAWAAGGSAAYLARAPPRG
ncbi:hypothetical protein [Rubrivivax rivuli]|uniref:Uncharacterized protein n=1 Tax=Rubrivivax rivuli TaxID=1862385 RepID=A0A437RK62_9BURK|nr:hypothetical protein [Rubrivivax rivuli]RVU47149.1 hypothetical protein EOE66_05135 [Rubrivivax rivuli]